MDKQLHAAQAEVVRLRAWCNEDRLCTCGTVGSGEQHEDWCLWEEFQPISTPLPDDAFIAEVDELQQERDAAIAERDALREGIDAALAVLPRRKPVGEFANLQRLVNLAIGMLESGNVK